MKVWWVIDDDHISKEEQIDRNSSSSVLRMMGRDSA